MEREFVNYNQALKLKELGFDEPCAACYYKKFDNEIGYHKVYRDFNFVQLTVSAPTYSQAFRWFREKYNLYHTIDKQGYWFFQIKKDEGFGDLTEVIVTYDYNSYEKAEVACLDKLIETVEQTERIEHGIYR